MPKPFPSRVVYQWFIIFAVIAIVPFIWFGLKMAVDAVVAWATMNFAEDFTGQRSGVVNFYNAVWAYMPIVVLIPVIVWAIMATMKERRYQVW